MPTITLCANVSYLHVSDLHLVEGESLIIEDENRLRNLHVRAVYEKRTTSEANVQSRRLLFTTSIFCHQNNREVRMFSCFCNFLLLATTEI